MHALPSTVPFAPGAREFAPFAATLADDIRWLAAADASTRLAGLRAFEEAAASATNFGGCVAIADGTSALEILLRLQPAKRGKEVVIPAWAPRRLRLGVEAAGFTPVYADVDLETQIVDPESVRACLSASTVAVLAWEAEGRQGKWQALRGVCDRLGIPLIVDGSGIVPRGAEAATARPHFVLLDFHGTSGVAALHELACLLGDDRSTLEEIRQAAYAARSRKLGALVRTAEAHPLDVRFLHRRLGMASKRAEWRRAIARSYARAFEPLQIAGSILVPQDSPVMRWTGYAIRTAPGRETLLARLREKLAQLPSADTFYLGSSAPERCPNATQLREQLLWLPCFAEMSPEEAEAVVETVAEWAPKTLSTSFFIGRSSRRTPDRSQGYAPAPGPRSI